VLEGQPYGEGHEAAATRVVERMIVAPIQEQFGFSQPHHQSPADHQPQAHPLIGLCDRGSQDVRIVTQTGGEKARAEREVGRDPRSSSWGSKEAAGETLRNERVDADGWLRGLRAPNKTGQ
jgi:hypothetical protein